MHTENSPNSKGLASHGLSSQRACVAAGPLHSHAGLAMSRHCCGPLLSSSSRLSAAGVFTALSIGGVLAAFRLPLGGNAIASMATSAAAASSAEPPRCRPVVLCGPSGAGKSTLIDRLRKEFPDDFGFSVSHTTRDPRPGEKDGVDYNFVSKTAMEAEIEEGKFLEHAHVHGNIYGTSFAAVDRVSGANKLCILDIDIQVSGPRTSACLVHKTLGMDISLPRRGVSRTRFSQAVIRHRVGGIPLHRFRSDHSCALCFPLLLERVGRHVVQEAQV